MPTIIINTLPLIINHDSKFKMRWDVLILVISVWNSFSIPIDIAFQPPFFQHPTNQICNHVVDAIFMLDILIHFRTSTLDEISGEWITLPNKIACAYVKSRFLLDILATIPFDTIFLSVLGKNISGKLSLLSLLKLFRVLRVFKIISYMNASESIKYSLKIFKMLFYLIMYIHC